MAQRISFLSKINSYHLSYTWNIQPTWHDEKENFNIFFPFHMLEYYVFCVFKSAISHINVKCAILSEEWLSRYADFVIAFLLLDAESVSFSKIPRNHYNRSQNRTLFAKTTCVMECLAFYLRQHQKTLRTKIHKKGIIIITLQMCIVALKRYIIALQLQFFHV